MKIFTSFFDFYKMTLEERKNINKSFSFFSPLLIKIPCFLIL